MKVQASLLALSLCGLLSTGCSSNKTGSAEQQAGTNTQAQTQTVTIGGEPVVTLQRPRSAEQNQPQFLQVQVLPGRGMNIFQVRAFLPGRGETDLFHSPSLQEAKQTLDNGDDKFGNKAFSFGGAILLPYANRIRGKLSPDGQTLTTTIDGKTVTLPANWAGKKPGAERHAMHGLILNAKFQDVKEQNGSDSSSVSGTYHAGNFDGHWLSDTDVQVETTLRDNAVELAVTAKNAGHEVLPMGIGWHPYFALPSGNREQARLHIPGTERAVVNNYDDVFPTGKLVPVKGTPYDFTAPDGKALGKLFLDDNFTNLQRQNGDVVSEIIDPAANYGLRVTALSPQVNAIQVYAPVEQPFVALEPQFNLGDPFGKEWHGRNTGMVMLKPGDSVTYRVRLELFTPQPAQK